MNNLETGHSKELSADLIVSIAEQLDVPIRWLVLGDPLSRYMRLTAREEEAMRALRRLPPAIQTHFLSSIVALATVRPTPEEPFPLAPKPVKK